MRILHIVWAIEAVVGEMYNQIVSAALANVLILKKLIVFGAKAADTSDTMQALCLASMASWSQTIAWKQVCSPHRTESMIKTKQQLWMFDTRKIMLQ